MLNLGDITLINGSECPSVDVIIGGSPCQNLSIAGKREGLKGNESSLFLHQIRIVKEMREHDMKVNGHVGEKIHPRYMVWENVPGAFSTHKGEDFYKVLTEIASITGENILIPRPPHCKWSTAGEIVGDSFSIAWRVVDAQYWGVPQRRRRIALVADFGGQCAGEILFKPQSLSGDIAQSRAQEERAAGSIETSIDSTICLQGNSIDRTEHSGCCGKGWRYDVAYTLNTTDRHAVVPTGDKIHLYPTNADGKINQNQITCLMDQGGSVMYALEGISGTLRAQEHGHQPLVYDARGNGNGETVCTITGDHQNRITDYTALVMAHGQANAEICEDLSPTLNCDHEQPIVTAVDCRNGTENQNVNGTLQAKSSGGMSVNLQNVVRVDKTVRRLTPVECERLQGYPDGWTDIGDWTDSKGKARATSDSARYKALGNSIALPAWEWLLQNISSTYNRTPTMASLFDGIGGFSLLWERINGKGTVKWISEIEPFPLAVTQRRFN